MGRVARIQPTLAATKIGQSRERRQEKDTGLISNFGFRDNPVDAIPLVCYERRKRLGIARKSYAKASKK